MFIRTLTAFIFIVLTPIVTRCQNNEDYLSNRTPMRWSKRLGDANMDAIARLKDATDQQTLASTLYGTYHPTETPIREYHHSSHEHHEHHEHIKEYGDGPHHQRDTSYHSDANHHHTDAHHVPASSHHHSVPILGHMLGHVPYHSSGDDHPGAISDVYRSQDTHGNYGFGYETRTIDGDANYRHEKKTGEVTEGAYGYKTDTAQAYNNFKHIPIHHHGPPVYSETPRTHYEQSYSIPISDIPPAASGHSPYHHEDRHPEVQYENSNHGNNYGHNLINLGHTDISPDEYVPLYHTSPIYHSEYDMNIPQALYSHLFNDIFKTDESISDISLPEEPKEPSAPEISSLSDAIRGIYHNDHMNAYISYLDSVIPSGIHNRLANTPVYRDKKKKRR